MFDMAPQRKLHVSKGQRFGRGIVIDPEVRIARPDRPGGERGARLRCDCGAEYDALLPHLCAGRVLSCGCQRSEKAAERLRQLHSGKPDGYRLPPSRGMTGHPLYQTWRGVLDRCENPRNKRYQRYGGRAIAVCDRWHDVRLFIQDIEQEIGVKPARCHECGGSYSLDRINNDRGYEPGNVRWATAVEQNSNKGPKAAGR
jgi:hypothetical protein